MEKSGETVEFVYNENGLRVQKTATSTGVTQYTLHGKNVVHMAQGSNELHFFYDAQNKPAVVVYNGSPYSYVKNLQGDIVAIIDSSYAIVVKYKYDAWGRPISCTGIKADSLGKINPFRYRGYVYDEETGMYYLRSRYYHPTWGRFINADVIIANDSFFSDNLFSYCLNSPIINKDDSGYGIYIQLRGGNKARIDNANTSTLEKRHIHIYENGKEYSQNDDGSPHKGDKGSPSNSVKKRTLRERRMGLGG